jgi:hypothetical protein
VPTITIKYEFQFADAAQGQVYEMTFDAARMMLIKEHPEASPDWTQLGFHQCSHCPLQAAQTEHCPIARNFSEVAEYFKPSISHHTAKVSVHTAQRTFVKETDLQTGIQSIFGLIMATSGCPHMDFLKLMARFHQPFSSLEETTVRSMSFYLLKQLARASVGETPDFKLEHLTAKYEKVNLVNRGIIERLRSLGGGDADRNALVILDSYAQLLPLAIEFDMSALMAKILALSESA